MKSNVKKLFTDMPNMDKETIAQFLQLLELPDDQFDQVYPMFKEHIHKIYEGEEFQKNLLNQMALIPTDSVEEEKKVIEEFLKEIYEDDTLSDSKKELVSLMFNSTLEVFERLLISGRQSVTVKITKLNPDAIIPTYAHPTDAGADVCAVEEVKIEPNETVAVKTGIAIAIPAGYEIQVRPRSGLSLRTGLRVANAPGTIDADYRGEVCIIITNLGQLPYLIDKGMKIAQLVIAPTPMIHWDEVESVEALGTTSRGNKGFGSTDKTANAS